jgi:hypothetical protein
MRRGAIFHDGAASFAETKMPNDSAKRFLEALALVSRGEYVEVNGDRGGDPEKDVDAFLLVLDISLSGAQESLLSAELRMLGRAAGILRDRWRKSRSSEEVCEKVGWTKVKTDNGKELDVYVDELEDQPGLEEMIAPPTDAG